MSVKVKKLHPLAQVPERGSKLAAGADLTAIENITIPPNQRQFIRTGIAIQATDKDIALVTYKDDSKSIDVPVYSYFQVAPRSGIAFKNGVMIMAGIVDLDYVGEVKVGIYNSSNEDFQVEVGMKIAQLIRKLCVLDEYFEVEELDQTERGEGGFGSTGS